MKMTFQPKKRQRSKVHGFRARMSSAGGRKVLAARRAKEERDYPHRPQFCGLFSLWRQFHEIYAVVEKEPAVPGGLQKRRFPRQQVFGHVCIGESSG